MSYATIEFIFAFAIFALLYWRLPPHRVRLIVLFAASLAFYAYGEPTGLPIIVLVISLTYAAGVASARWPARSALITTAGVVVLLANLAFFKYSRFAVSVMPIFRDAVPPVLLPLGISFFTFEAISYLVDLRRGVTPVERSPLRLGLFIAVFPHLISGPIMRPNGFLPQLRRPAQWDSSRFASGLALFVEGLAKKLLIADVAGSIADRVFAAPNEASSTAAWVGALAYTLQIYGDFSGYTDMGRGAARILGLELPLNFNAPYLATSPADFWRRWHISLSSWLRDYLYIPLGGNRRGRARSYVNLLLTMLLGGLWHGAGWTFIAWGGYHGVLLALQRGIGARVRIPHALAVAGTLFLVVNGWVLFRSRDFTVWLQMLRAMYMPRAGAPTVGLVSMIFVLSAFAFTVGVMALAQWRPAWIDRLRAQHSVTGIGYGLVAGCSLAVMLLRDAPTPFIYFRF